MKPVPSQTDRASRKSGIESRGNAFTLVEVMVTAAVATVSLFVLLGTLLIAYRVNHSARLRDNARAVLRTYADQFQRLAYAEDGVIRLLFTPTSAPTDEGLAWGELSDKIPGEVTYTPLVLNLGSATSAQIATVTREVSFVDPATGEASITQIDDAAGFMMKAKFVVTYELNGRSITHEISTLRLID